VDLAEAVRAAHEAGFRVLAADGSGDDLNEVAASGGLRGKVAWIMGNEAWGLPQSQLALADGVVRIPMWGHAESLNLGSAAAVCLYATASAQHAGGPLPETAAKNV
jgi:TrmH family RNA methyltransferase